LKVPEPPPETEPPPVPPAVAPGGDPAAPHRAAAPRAAATARAVERARTGVVNAGPSAGATDWRPVPGVITRPEMWRRAIAKSIDLVGVGAIVWGFGLAIGSRPLAAIAAYVWFLLSDWFGSPGKTLLGLKTVLAGNGLPCTASASLKRNLPLVAINFFWPLADLGFQLSRADLRTEMPALSMFLATAVLAIWAIEMGTGNAHVRGQRLGDRWAKTQVIRRPGG